MIAYRATLDVPRELVQFTAKLLAAERRRRGTPRGSRALTCFWQAVLGLRWFRDRTSPDALAREGMPVFARPSDLVTYETTWTGRLRGDLTYAYRHAKVSARSLSIRLRTARSS